MLSAGTQRTLACVRSASAAQTRACAAATISGRASESRSAVARLIGNRTSVGSSRRGIELHVGRQRGAGASRPRRAAGPRRGGRRRPRRRQGGRHLPADVRHRGDRHERRRGQLPAAPLHEAFDDGGHRRGQRGRRHRPRGATDRPPPSRRPAAGPRTGRPRHRARARPRSASAARQTVPSFASHSVHESLDAIAGDPAFIGWPAAARGPPGGRKFGRAVSTGWTSPGGCNDVTSWAG